MCNASCTSAEIQLPATAQGKHWRNLRKAQKLLHPGGPASQLCCGQHASGLLACPCFQHFLFFTCSFHPGKQCCGVCTFHNHVSLPASVMAALRKLWCGEDGKVHMELPSWQTAGFQSMSPAALMSACTCGSNGCLSLWISSDSLHLSPKP